jgi:hypothetical protein
MSVKYWPLLQNVTVLVNPLSKPELFEVSLWPVPVTIAYLYYSR